MKKFPFTVGQKVIKTSGKWLGCCVKIKSIFPNVNEILVENQFGFIDKVTTWDVRIVTDKDIV